MVKRKRVMVAAVMCALGMLVALTSIPPVKAFAQTAVNDGKLWLIPGGLDVVGLITSDGGMVVGANGVVPITAGSSSLGSGAKPFPSIALGTAATNNTIINGLATAAARTINIPDYLSNQNFPGTVFLTGSAYTNATTTFSNVTGLAFPVAASTNYRAVCRITWQGSAGTTGPKYQFTGPGSPTAVAVGLNSVITATTVIAASAVAFSSPVANTGTVTTATNFTDTIDVAVINGANAGIVQLQAAANGAGTLTIQPGSHCDVQ